MADADRENQHDGTVSVVDRQVADKMRLRRQALGLTQRQLAELIGRVYQQVQKYELGIDCINVEQLHAIALALSTNVAFFFEKIEPKPITAVQQDGQRRLLELMRTVENIGSPEHRQAVCAVARALAELSDQQPGELA